MPRLRYILPPVNSLVVFEAAARHLNFTQAASELGVSQAAISRQIHALEEYVGTALFQRLSRGVRLTAEGDHLHAAVTMGLGHIAKTSSALVRANGHAEVMVWTGVGFAAFWLMPRLRNFYAAHPGIDLRLLATASPRDLRAENIDVAVRVCNGDHPGLRTVKLFGEEVFPVCSPAYLAGRPPLREPADLLGENLLHEEVLEPTWLSWADWMERIGVAAPANMPGMSANNYAIVIQAAQAGQGIALGWHHLVSEFIEDGSLVRPIPDSVHLDCGYYMMLPTDRELSPAAAIFRNWLISEAARSG